VNIAWVERNPNFQSEFSDLKLTSIIEMIGTHSLSDIGRSDHTPMSKWLPNITLRGTGVEGGGSGEERGGGLEPLCSASLSQCSHEAK